jgi:hypothetical protein
MVLLKPKLFTKCVSMVMLALMDLPSMGEIMPCNYLHVTPDKYINGYVNNFVWMDPLGGCFSQSSPHQSSPTQMHCVKTINTNNQRHSRQKEKRPVSRVAESATTGISEYRSLSTGSQFV